MTLTLRDIAFMTGFNAAPCAIPATLNGGGTTFDCYAVGDYTGKPLPRAGTRIGRWIVSDNLFGRPYGDSYDTYAVGTPGAAGLNAGIGVGTWIFGDNLFNRPYGDSYETYTVGTPGAAGLNAGIGVGTWIFGDGP